MSLPTSLQNYLTDLALTTPTDLSLAFVTTLQQQHIAKYSFNSLAVILGEEISLELEAVSQKIVSQGLGGYCFEHNTLSFELLKALGYEVQLTLARVLYNQQKSAPRTHRVTLLRHQQDTYLVDTGFGAYGPNAPLLLQPNLEQSLGEETYRLIQTSTVVSATSPIEYDLQIFKDGAFFTLYRFDLATYSEADCLLGHFFSHKHPTAGFVNNLVISLKNDQRVIAIKNHSFITRQQGKEHQSVIETPQELHRLLTTQFHLDIEPVISQHLFARFLEPKITQLQVEKANKVEKIEKVVS